MGLGMEVLFFLFFWKEGDSYILVGIRCFNENLGFLNLS